MKTVKTGNNSGLSSWEDTNFRKWVAAAFGIEHATDVLEFTLTSDSNCYRLHRASSTPKIDPRTYFTTEFTENTEAESEPQRYSAA